MITKPLLRTVDGFGTLVVNPSSDTRDVTTPDYHADQAAHQPVKARNYIFPILREQPVRTVLDVGCGIGAMVLAAREDGYDAVGVDVIGMDRRWAQLGRDPSQFLIIDPARFELPFLDETIDFAFSIGVIEHVGTADGHATRLPDYHALRQQWTREIFRCLKVGGRMLLGGPNRHFPFDAAHGLDSQASGWERWLSAKAAMSVHRIWGEGFLWSYGDVARYLHGLPHSMTPRSIDGLLEFGRAPASVRSGVRAYIRHLPKPLLGTGFNPWVMALVTRTG